MADVVEIDVANLATGDTGICFFITTFLCAPFGVCFWKRFSNRFKAKIFLVLNVIIGSGDTIMDWIVLSTWFSKGLWGLALLLLFTIMISGTFFASIALLEHKVSKMLMESDERLLSYRNYLLPLFVIGLGNVALGLLILNDPNGKIDINLYYEFNIGRLVEIFVEAAPGGGLQFFYLITDNDLTKYTSINFISVIFSVISIGIAMEEAVGKMISMTSRVMLWLFAVTDFVFRVSSISFLFQASPTSAYCVIVALYLFELLPWKFQNDRLIKRGFLVNCGYLYFFALGIPSLCTSGTHFCLKEFDFTRKYFFQLFIARWIASVTIFVVAISTSERFEFLSIGGISGVISLLLSWKIHRLLRLEGNKFCMSKVSLTAKLETTQPTIMEYIDSQNDIGIQDLVAKGQILDEEQWSRSVRVAETNLNDILFKELMSIAHRYGFSGWMFAAEFDQISSLQRMINAGINIDIQINDGNSALIIAAYNGNDSIVNTLIKAGVQIDLQNNNGNSALMIAAGNGKDSTVNTLIKAGVQIDLQNNNGNSALMIAAYNGNDSIVNTFIKVGAQIDLQDNDGYSALMRAAAYGRDSTVNTLIKAGAQINLQNNNGNSALMIAAAKGRDSTVNTLIKAGAQIDLRNNNGTSALITAAAKGRDSTVNTLIKAGAQVDLQNNDGYSALMRAAAYGRDSTVNTLIKAGAQINLQNTNGTSALITAADSGKDSTVNTLIKAGAQVDLQKNDGYSALITAAGRGKDSTVNTLIKAGAQVDLQKK